MEKFMKKKALRAAVCSTLMPGLGLLYCGDVYRFIFLVVMVALLPLLGSILALSFGTPYIWFIALFFVFLSTCFYFYGILKSYQLGKQIENFNEVKSYNRPDFYFVLIAIFYTLIFQSPIFSFRKNLLESYRVPSVSLEPNIMAGDFIFVDKRYNQRGRQEKIKRGDLVTFRFPNDGRVAYIKRIIGLPGDDIKIEGENLLVNGKQINHLVKEKKDDEFRFYEEEGDEGNRYLVKWATEDSFAERRKDFHLVVPNGQVFLLGDNRDYSYDSRFWGTASVMEIEGKAKQVWFSTDNSGSIRFSRLGKVL